MTTKPVQEFSDKVAPKIDMTPVVSSQIKAIGYDPELKILAIEFKYGAAVYHYPGVTQEVFDAMNDSESIGKFFGTHIKNLAFDKYKKETKETKETFAESEVNNA